MQKAFFITIWSLLVLIPGSVKAQSLVIDHQSVSRFDSIPEVYKQAASDLRMLFMDRSVGFNISTYLDCLSESWEDAPNSCKRHTHQDSLYAVEPSEVYWDGVWDRTNWHYAFWPTGCSEDVTCFLDYMDADDRLDSFDVFGVQFSYLAVTPGSHIADPVNGFFGTQGSENKASTYAAYAETHPDKKVIWWTTSLARGIGTPESESFNTQMREYATAHDIILFDVADILSHDPAGTPCYDNRDGIAYKDENHVDDGMLIPAICPQYTTETEGGHLGSISAGGNRVVKAFWVLMARIAGWQDMATSVEKTEKETLKIVPNPARDFVEIRGRDSTTPAFVRIVDVMGKICATQQMDHSHTPFQVKTGHLAPGVYYVQVMQGGWWSTVKIILA